MGGPSAPLHVSNFERILTPTIQIQGNFNPCAGSVESYKASVDGAAPYKWSIKPEEAGSILSGNGTEEIVVRWHQVNSNSIKLHLSAISCVATADSQTVHISGNNLSIVCPNGCKVCAGSLTDLVASDTTGTDYDWYVDDILVPGQDSAVLHYIFSQPGTRFVRVRMTGGPSCPGIVEDVLSLTVVPNPPPIITLMDVLDCDHLDTIRLAASSYTLASSETFIWEKDGFPVTTSPYFPMGPVLTVLGNLVSDYTGIYQVEVIRTAADSSTCIAVADFSLLCNTIPVDPNPTDGIEFEDWNFDLTTPCTGCKPAGTADGIACGYVQVKGNIGGRSFTDVDIAQWRVFDPQNGLNPVDIFPITDQGDLDNTNISIFSKAGFYPSALQVRFIGDSVGLADFRTIEIPMKPAINYEQSCCDTLAGAFDVEWQNISTRVGAAPLDSSRWEIMNLGTEVVETVTTTEGQISRCYPGGSVLKVCLTSFTRTAGADKPGMPYYCTTCDTITLGDTLSATIILGRNVVCKGTPVQMEGVSSPSGIGIQYFWDFGDQSSGTGITQAKTYALPGTYPVHLRVKTARGCFLAASDTVVVEDNHLMGSIKTMNAACNASATLLFEVGGTPPPYSFFWTPTGDTTQVIMTTLSGMHKVTVTDSLGCKLETSTDLNLAPVLPNGITGQFRFCATPITKNYQIIPAVGYEYNWETNFPNIQYFTNSAGQRTILRVLNPDTAGIYFVRVKAIFSRDTCVTITETVVVDPKSVPPIVNIDYTCMPFSANLSTAPSQDVSWNLNKGTYRDYIGYASNIWVFRGGSYQAIATNEYGCSASQSVTVANPINTSTLTGCYSLCDTLLENEQICLPAPPGSYTEWSWIQLPGTVLKSGAGPVDTLCLNADMVGDIVFTASHQYHNSSPLPSGSALVCTDTSGTFCLEVLQCASCPTDLTVVSHLSIQTALCSEFATGQFYESVFMISGAIALPVGWEYCDTPTVTGGYINYAAGFPYVDPGNPDTVQIQGFLHVTDSLDFYTGGLTGTIQLCHSGDSSQMCPADFVIPSAPCTEPVWCMYILNEEWDFSNSNSEYWTLTRTFTFPAHYVTREPYCDITEYIAWIAINDTLADNGDTIYLEGPITFTAPPSSDTIHSVSLIMTLPQWLEVGNIDFVYRSNCSEICEFVEYYDPQRPLSPTVTPKAALPSKLIIQPNPSDGYVVFGYAVVSALQQAEGCSIAIFNGMGQLINHTHLSTCEGTMRLDTQNWPPGVYTCVLESGGFIVEQKRLVVAR